MSLFGEYFTINRGFGVRPLFGGVEEKNPNLPYIKYEPVPEVC